MESSLPASFGDVALLESNLDVNWQHNQLIDNNVQPLDSTDSNSFVGDGQRTDDTPRSRYDPNRFDAEKYRPIRYRYDSLT